LGAILKQIVGELDEVPGEIDPAYGIGKRVISGQEPPLSDAMRRLQTTASEKPTFI